MKLQASRFGFVLVFALALSFTGCNTESDPIVPQTSPNTDTETPAMFRAQTGGMIWADCELFGTVGTPAHFDPESGNFDNLYQGPFKDGIGAISEAKPGDQDYNGGRWHVHALKEGVDGSKYNDACSVDDLDLNDFESTGTYFECPLLPRRGNGNGNH